MSKNLPSITSNIPRDLRMFVDRLREMVNGNGAGRLVSAQDLSDAGLASVDSSGNIIPPTTYVNTPPAPTGLTATAAINTVLVEWDVVTYYGHAYAEVWGSSTNNLGAAVLLGQTPGFIYTDAIGPGATRYYWVRFVNVNDQIGPYNAVSGVSATTAADLAHTMDVLAAAYGDTSEAPFFQLNSPQTIDGVVIPAGTYMKAGFIYDGVITNAKIGNAAVDNAKIANLSADKINAGTISADRIGANSITAAKIDSRNLSIKDAAGNILFASGTNLNYANITASSGWLNSNVSIASNGSLSGAGGGQVTYSGVGGKAMGLIDQITSSNVSTYIASAAIQTAQIGDAQITNAKIGDTIQSNNFSSGSAGWRILKNGSAEFNGPVISRNIVVASGTYAAWTTNTSFNTYVGNYLGYNWYEIGSEWIDTGFVSEPWGATNSALIFAAGVNDGVSINYSYEDPTGRWIWFYVRVTELNFQWRWNGNPQVFAKITLFASPGAGVVSFALQYGGSGGIDWKLYKVT